MKLRKPVVKAVLFVSFLSLFLAPLPQSPFNIPKVNASSGSVSYDSSSNTVTFNKNSTNFFYDWWTNDTANNLTLVTSTQRHHFQNYDASRSPTWLDQTTGANNDTANDIYLVPNNPVAVGDECYWGNEAKMFNKITLNVTTAGVYTSTITWQYRSSSWVTLTVTQSPNPVFKSVGVGTIRFTPPTNWVKITVNGINAYWVRARVTTAGTVTTQPLGGRSWLSYDINLQIRPAENLALKVDAVITSYTTSGTVTIDGTDEDNIATSETLTINSASTFQTVEKFKTINSYGIKQSGEFTFYIQQRRWGSLAYFSDATFGMFSDINLGDGATTLSISDINKQVEGNWYLITVKNMVNLTFGSLLDATNKLGYEGLQFHDVDLTSEEGTNTRLYASDFYMSVVALLGHNWVYDCTITGMATAIENANAYNLNVYNTYITAEPPYITNGTFKRILVYGGDYFLYLDTNPITIKDAVFRNATVNAFLIANLASDSNLINVDSDSWSFAWYGTSIGKIWRKYTFDLAVTYENGILCQNANVTIKNNYGYYGNWLTDANGRIPQTTLSMGYYNQTGGNTIHSVNPYNLTITKTGYSTYTSLFNMTELRTNFWQVALTPTTDIETPFTIGIFAGAILIGLVALAGILVIGKKH